MRVTPTLGTSPDLMNDRFVGWGLSIDRMRQVYDRMEFAG